MDYCGMIVVSLIPYLRNRSAALAPAWCSFSTPMTCCCVNLHRFIVRLLMTDPNFKLRRFQGQSQLAHLAIGHIHQ